MDALHSKAQCVARCTAVPKLNALAKFTQTCGPLSLVQTNLLFDLAFSELHVSLQSLL